MNALLRTLSVLALTLIFAAGVQARTLQLGTVQDEESSNNWQALSENLLGSGDTFPSGGYVVVGKKGSVFMSTITGTRSGLNEGAITILASVPYKTIVIHDISVYASGGVASATSLDLEQTVDSADVAKYASALLVDDQPVHLASATQAGIGATSGLTRGSGLKMKLNDSGNGDTTSGASQIFYNILYSLQ